MEEIDINDTLTVWTAFLNDPNNEKVIEFESVLAELHEAKIELARISRDPKEAENYRLRQNAMNERMNALLEAEDKGITKGIAKAKIEMALNLLKMEISSEIISEATGLSQEEINQLSTSDSISL